MPDEQGRPVRGEVGHPFYRKDLAKGLKFDKKGVMISQGPPEAGMTDTNTQGLKGTDLPKTPAGTPDPRGIYTKSVAKGFNKNEQINLLKARKVRVVRRDTEVTLIAKILDSNPKGDQNPKDEETDALPEAPQVEEGTIIAKFTEEQLKDYKPAKLVEIIRGLTTNKIIPFSEKGRIKKILELQDGGDSSA